MIDKQSYLYKQTPGCSIYADVYQPAGPGPHPAILWLHGGALIFGSRSSLPISQAEAYVNAGYTVVAVDYRLAPETKLAAIIEDLQDAYLWLREQGPALLNIDPQRITVMGHSAGGYLTLLLGYRVSPRPRALVSFYGYGDIIGPWYTLPSPHYCQQPLVTLENATRAVGVNPLSGSADMDRFTFYLYGRQHGLWPQQVAGHDPVRESAWFAPYCPLRNVTAVYPATLLIHGDQDTDVPCEQSLFMAEALQRHGVVHEMMLLPGRGHVFDTQGDGMKDPVIANVFARVLAFLREQGM